MNFKNKNLKGRFICVYQSAFFFHSQILFAGNDIPRTSLYLKICEF